MKIKLEFELTPQEFRQSLGLPDITAMQDKVMSALQTRMSSDLKDVDVPAVVEGWLNQGLATSRQIQKLFTSAVDGVMDAQFDSKAGAANTTDSKKKKPR